MVLKMLSHSKLHLVLFMGKQHLCLYVKSQKEWRKMTRNNSSFPEPDGRVFSQKNLAPTVTLLHINDQGRTYRQTSNISCTLVGNRIFYHSDVVGASPVGAAPTTSSFST